MTRLDGQRRLFAGTPDKIFEAVSNQWIDRSKAGGYTSTADGRWRFAQFGNVTLATNQSDKIQASTSGEFDDISEAPAAKIIITTSGFVMAFGTSDSTYGDSPDGWWCSGLYDHTTWTPSQATQAANGRFLDTPGDVRAAKTLGSIVVAYKERSMYIGQYVGPPVIWSWSQVPGEVGALSNDCVIDIGTAHAFIGVDDFWVYDGSRPERIGAPIREWFFEEMDPEYSYRVQGYYDRQKDLLAWYFPSRGSGGKLNRCVLYNTKTKQWGKATREIQATVEYVTSAITYDELGDKYETYDSFDDITYDSPRWLANSAAPAIVDASNVVGLLLGEPLPCSLTTWDLGDDATYSALTRVRARFLSNPVTGKLQAYYKDDPADTPIMGKSATLDRARFDLLWSARWHRLRMDFTGPVEISALQFDLAADGTI